jgi:excinuclease ABC subunit A
VKNLRKILAQNSIHIKGARVHNLRNVEVDIPHNQLVVITGLSGSGKSTLAFDTIFAEGQRRYVESLSAYARQFLGRIDKPDVDFITGIAPAIAIEQKVNTRNPRSTVGTSTEIYDYLKLLFARIGHTFSPVSGREVRSFGVDDVAAYVAELPEGERVVVAAPLVLEIGQGLIERLTVLLAEGVQRVWRFGKVQLIEDLLPTLSQEAGAEGIDVVIDRFKVVKNEEFLGRASDSIARAFSYGSGVCKIISGVDTGAGAESGNPVVSEFSSRFEMDGIVFEQPSEHLFSFNNPIGACPVCEGYGRVTGIDEDLVVPDKTKSVYDEAIMAWRGETMSWWRKQLVDNAWRFDFPIHAPFFDLTPEQRRLLWTGNEWFKGLDDFFKFLENEQYKIQYRVMLSRYTGKTICPECGGGRLRKEAFWVKIGGRSIDQLVRMTVDELRLFFSEISLDEHDRETGRRILTEIKNRLQYLVDVGLGYLTLDRLSSTLSGGESQRINLSASLGSNLVGSLYILDEPSIGLHPRDTERLIGVLKQLRDLGNTVIVVEHDEETMRAADQIIDIGPRAGYKGGEIVYSGDFQGLLKAKNSLTADYLTGRRRIEPPENPRGWRNFVELKGVRENNLKGVDVRFPLGVMTCVTGVSGSGKSSLVRGVLYPALKRRLDETGLKPGSFASLEGDVKLLKGVEMIDQNPIGRSSRSNPVTYIKAYDEIRKLFADQPYAKHNGIPPSYFSFNTEGGRCEECQGEGVIRVEMQFMADVELTCETCGGHRFKDEILEVRYRDRNIFDVLEMTVDEAITFFGEESTPTTRRIVERLGALQGVGLGYVKLGQSSSTLSGGESQRVKLASFLLRDNSEGRVMFIFDEPTTGLHFHDINKLLTSLNALISKGHTVIIIEHNPDVIRCADHVIDLGPEGGAEGGLVVFEGTPAELEKCSESYTGRFLTSRPETTRPEATKPEATQPEATQPEATKPQATRSGAVKKGATGSKTKPKATKN